MSWRVNTNEALGASQRSLSNPWIFFNDLSKLFSCKTEVVYLAVRYQIVMNEGWDNNSVAKIICCASMKS